MRCYHFGHIVAYYTDMFAPEPVAPGIVYEARSALVNTGQEDGNFHRYLAAHIAAEPDIAVVEPDIVAAVHIVAQAHIAAAVAAWFAAASALQHSLR